MVIIEVDGPQHDFDHKQVIKDRIKDEYVVDSKKQMIRVSVREKDLIGNVFAALSGGGKQAGGSKAPKPKRASKPRLRRR